MNGSLRGLASCKAERPGDPSGAVPCAELLVVSRQKGKPIPLTVALRIAREVLDRLDRDRPPASVLQREGDVPQYLQGAEIFLYSFNL